MRKLLIAIAAAAALALPAAAAASGILWPVHGHALFAKLSGTGATFAASSTTASGSIVAGSPLAGGTFSANLSTNWAQATTKTGDYGTLSCAPATLKLTLTAATSSANTETSTLTGRTCTFTNTDGTVFRSFFGRGIATGAGTLSGLTGTTERAFLRQKADGTVKGIVFARQTLAAHQTGDGH
jgi:hypothetical protein